MACLSLPIAIFPSGTSTPQVMPALVAYAAAEALVLPVEAQITALAPCRAATDIAVVMPRSLNDPVGLTPSYLMKTSAPTRSLRWAARISGVPPSPRVTIGAPASEGSRSAYSWITPRHRWAPVWTLVLVWALAWVILFAFDAHHRGDTAHSGQGGQRIDRCGQGSIRSRVGDHDEACAPLVRVVRIW